MGESLKGLSALPFDVAKNYMGSQAQKKAIEEQKRALARLKSIDIEKYKKEANLGDREEYANRLENLRITDPELAKVRDASVANLLETIQPSQPTRADRVADLLVERATEENPLMRRLEQRFLELANTRLDEGAELPPEFQAELVRSGLEQAGTTGAGANRSGPLAQLLGTRIGEAGLQLERQRVSEALGLTQASEALKNNRTNILRGLATDLQNLELSRTNVARTALTDIYAQGPGGGLDGDDVINALETNRQLKNYQILGKGQLNAMNEMRRGAETGGYIQALQNNQNAAIDLGLDIDDRAHSRFMDFAGVVTDFMGAFGGGGMMGGGG